MWAGLACGHELCECTSKLAVGGQHPAGHDPKVPTAGVHHGTTSLTHDQGACCHIPAPPKANLIEPACVAAFALLGVNPCGMGAAM